MYIKIWCFLIYYLKNIYLKVIVKKHHLQVGYYIIFINQYISWIEALSRNIQLKSFKNYFLMLIAFSVTLYNVLIERKTHSHKLLWEFRPKQNMKHYLNVLREFSTLLVIVLKMHHMFIWNYIKRLRYL